jgi:hypothetical protein
VKLTSRQLVVRGRELAALLLRSLERDRMVARFVDTYAVEYERPCCTAYAGQYRETVSNICRESLLVMTVWMERETPRFLSPGSKGKLPSRGNSRGKPVRGKKAARRPKKISSPSLEAREVFAIFHDEFLDALAQALEWPEPEIEEFQRDLSLYRKLDAGGSPSRSSRPAGRQLAAHVEGPFVDRCGVLLDPSMLDKSRLAAARFQNQLHVATQAALNQIFSSRRAN